MTKPRNTASATNPSPIRSTWRCSSCGGPERRLARFLAGRGGRRRACAWARACAWRWCFGRRPWSASFASTPPTFILRKGIRFSLARREWLHPRSAGARRRGRRGHRPGRPALAAHGGLRGAHRRRRRGRARARRRVHARPRDPRPRPAQARRDRGRAPSALRRRRPDPHADRARRARQPRRGPRLGRRRLPGQAVRAPGAARAPARAAAPPPATRLAQLRRRRPVAQPRHPRGACAASARSS